MGVSAGGAIGAVIGGYAGINIITLTKINKSNHIKNLVVSLFLSFVAWFIYVSIAGMIHYFFPLSST